MAQILETVGPRSGGAPLVYVLAESGTVDVQTIFAHFDGSGASGGFRPTLTVKAQNGTILGRWFPNDELAAGDSCDCTWSPFFRRSTSAAPGTAFPTLVAALATTRTLVGYWRLGEGASPFLDTSAYPQGPANMVRLVGAGIHMNQDYNPGALSPAGGDDGAVAFVDPAGLTNSDSLHANEIGAPQRFNMATASLGAGKMTVAGFVKPFSTASTFTGSIASMWALGASFGGWNLYVSWPTRQVFFTKGGDGHPTGLVSGPLLAANVWRFVVATHSATNGLRLYIDGALYATTAGNFSDGPAFNIGVDIARFADSGTAKRAYAAIDEVSVWADELSAVEILTLAQAAGYA